ncbi:class I SAM-dependent methyltransferase [Dokdonella sp.]|uniref:class I SAM-dependent methyltransferase n=1 Tax=Dokdonella sp. TaxID=2291710 RepID=UPI00378342E5
MYESMHSLDERRRKAATMVAVLREALGPALAQAHALNLGCSTGIIDEYIAGHVRTMTGVDIDEPAIALATSRITAQNLRFQLGDAMNLAFDDGTFDIVVCSQVYEHVPDARRMMMEIRRVLRPGGVCYFAATNRWALIEKHHRLPFLSWLPARVADRYMRWAGKGEAYYERHLGYGALRDLASAFRIEDYTGKVLSDPERYEAAYLFRTRFARVAARSMYGLLRRMFPGYIWLLWKET